MFLLYSWCTQSAKPMDTVFLFNRKQASYFKQIIILLFFFLIVFQLKLILEVYRVNLFILGELYTYNLISFHFTHSCFTMSMKFYCYFYCKRFYWHTVIWHLFPYRHALPLFTSLLNIVCAYDPVGYGVPYNHLMFNDSSEPLVEGSLQVLCVTLENDSSNQNVSVDGTSGGTAMDQQSEVRSFVFGGKKQFISFVFC